MLAFAAAFINWLFNYGPTCSLAFLIIAYLHWRYRTYEFSRKCRFTELAPSIPIIGHAYFTKGDYHSSLDFVVKNVEIQNSPTLFWITGFMPLLIISKAEDMAAVLTSASALNKGPAVKMVMTRLLGDGILLSDGHIWKPHRRILSQTFNTGILNSYHSIRVQQFDILVKQLKNEIDKDSFDLWDYMSKATLDVVCATLMGLQVDSQIDDKSLYLDSLNGMLETLKQRGVCPWYYPEIIFRFTHLCKEMTMHSNVVKKFRNKMIEEKLVNSTNNNESNLKSEKESCFDDFIDDGKHVGSNGKQRKVLLDFLIEVCKNNPEMNVKYLGDHIDNFLFAGYDTTATALCFITVALAVYEDIQVKVYQELRGIFNDSDRAIETEDLKQMTYLEMVIKESIRFFSIVPLSFRQTIAPVQLADGRVIPAGVDLVLFYFLTHQDPKHWPQPEKFVPERFLPENSKHRHPFAFVGFSGGQRNCIGLRYAMLTLKTAIASIIRSYSVTTKLTESDLVDFKFDITMKLKKGFHVKIEQRNVVEQNNNL